METNYTTAMLGLVCQHENKEIANIRFLDFNGKEIPIEQVNVNSVYVNCDCRCTACGAMSASDQSYAEYQVRMRFRQWMAIERNEKIIESIQAALPADSGFSRTNAPYEGSHSYLSHASSRSQISVNEKMQKGGRRSIHRHTGEYYIEVSGDGHCSRFFQHNGGQFNMLKVVRKALALSQAAQRKIDMDQAERFGNKLIELSKHGIEVSYDKSTRALTVVGISAEQANYLLSQIKH